MQSWLGFYQYQQYKFLFDLYFLIYNFEIIDCDMQRLKKENCLMNVSELQNPKRSYSIPSAQKGSYYTNPSQMIITQEDRMEFELTKSSWFLDVSEFTLQMPKESPYLPPIHWESHHTHRHTKSPPPLKATPHLFSECLPGQSLPEGDIPSILPVGEIDFVTPYSLCRSQESLSDFQLDAQEQMQALSPEEHSSQPSDHLDSCQSNSPSSELQIDLLDAIEQQCQRQLQITRATSWLQSSTSIEPAPEKSEVVDPPSDSNYHWLSFKESNIQSLAFHSPSEYLLEDRKTKVQRYMFKRMNRSWRKKISYICRKQVADARLRVKGRFITRTQANQILGIDTADLTLDEIKCLIDHKLSLKQKDLSETAGEASDEVKVEER